MSTLPRIVWLLAATGMLAATAGASQQVWVVAPVAGPGVDDTQISGAVNHAASGDIVLVRSGTYGPVAILGKGVSIVADAGAVVTVKPFDFASSPFAVAVQQVPAGQSVLLFGLQCSTPSTQISPTLRVTDCLGGVAVEQCTIVGGTPAITVTNCDDVTFTHCTSTGLNSIHTAPFGYWSEPGAGLQAAGSTVSVQGCMLTGGNGGAQSGISGEFFAVPGGDGVRVDSGLLVAGDSTFTGGVGGAGTISGGPFSSCYSAEPGGPALRLHNGSPSVALRSTTLVVGAPGAPGGPQCEPTLSGDALVVQTGAVTQLDGAAPVLTTNSPVREGQLAMLGLSAAPGSAALLVLSLAPDVIYLPKLSGALATALPFSVTALGSVPADGTLELQAVVPNLGAFEGVAVYVQGAAYDAGVGHLVLGNGASLVLLDASL